MNVIARAQHGIDRYHPGDRPALDAFQRAAFGDDALQRDPAHFRWAFENVPAADPAGVQLWVCQRRDRAGQDRVVGQQAGIPFNLKAGARMRRASWAIDLMVAAEWRLRGVGPALSHTHAAASDVAVSLGISDAAYKAYKSDGWIDLGGLPSYVRVIDPLRCAQAASYRGRVSRLLAACGSPVATAASLGFAALARTRGLHLSEVAAFDDRVDGLWSAVAPHHPLIAERNHRFLAWRFDHCPGSGNFRRLYALRHGQLMGYVVLRTERWRDTPVGVVIDYLAKPGWTGPLFALAVEFARHESLAALLCRTLNPKIGRPLASIGFLCLRNGLNTPTRMMVRPGPAGEDMTDLLGNRQNWFVTAADSDLSFQEIGR